MPKGLVLARRRGDALVADVRARPARRRQGSQLAPPGLAVVVVVIVVVVGVVVPPAAEERVEGQPSLLGCLPDGGQADGGGGRVEVPLGA